MAAERGILRPLMYKAIEQGTSFNAFYRSAKEHGISYRRADMLADYADARNESRQREQFKSLTSGDYPETIEIGTMKFTRPGAFYYKLRAEVIEMPGAKPTERFVTVVSDDPLTVRGIQEQIAEKWPSFEYGKRERLKTTTLVAALYRPAP